MTTATPTRESTPKGKERDLLAVPVSPRGNRWYGVLSSDGETIYRVHVGKSYETCECRGFQSYRHCYHVDAVRAQYGELPVYCCGGCAVLLPIGTTHERGACGRIHAAGIAAFRGAR